ncbi:MAG: DUF4235 domain-containing protein [Propionibacteriales bacterium]|nr:DUF4235 domain-containing protein [Propionibacteriales bacterium]
MAKKATSAEDKAAKKKAQKGKRAWKYLGSAIGMASGVVTMKALDATWHTATGRKAPTKPENPDIAGREALVWAAVSGMALGVARTYATRRAAQYWIRSFGTLPPGMDEGSAADKQKLRKQAKERG